MSEPSTIDKGSLVADLRASGQAALRTLRALPEPAFREGRYESGWNAGQILAHLAAIEWTYPRLLDLGAGAASGGVAAGGSGEARGGMDAYNARQVEKRANTSIPELLAELERNRAVLVRAVEAADAAILAAPVRSAGGRTGSVAQVLREVAIGHVRGHVADIVGAAD